MSWFVHKIAYDETRRHKIDRGYFEIVDGPLTGAEWGDKVKLENAYSGWHYYTIQPDDEIIESDWDTVERQYYLDKQDAEYGWIAPDGTFYGCEYEDHAHCIYAISNMYETQAEEAGWIKIYRDAIMASWHPEHTNVFDGYYYIDANVKMTSEQKKTLYQRGFKIENFYT